MQNCIFAGRKYYSCEGKSACQPQRLAHDLLRFAERNFFIRTSAKLHNLSDFSKQIKHKQFIKDIKCPKTQTIDYLCILLNYRFFLKNAQKSFVFGKLLLPL